MKAARIRAIGDDTDDENERPAVIERHQNKQQDSQSQNLDGSVQSQTSVIHFVFTFVCTRGQWEINDQTIIKTDNIPLILGEKNCLPYQFEKKSVRQSTRMDRLPNASSLD